MKLCLRHVKDIPEEALIQVLKRVISANSNESLPTVNGMNVDSMPSPNRRAAKPTIPSLQEFLVLLVQYPTTAGPLRVAMKKHLSVDDLAPILGALDRTIGKELHDVSAMATRDSKRSPFAQASLPVRNSHSPLLLTRISLLLVYPILPTNSRHVPALYPLFRYYFLGFSTRTPNLDSLDLNARSK